MYAPVWLLHNFSHSWVTNSSLATLQSGAVIRNKYEKVFAIPAGFCAGILKTHLLCEQVNDDPSWCWGSDPAGAQWTDWDTAVGKKHHTVVI